VATIIGIRHRSAIPKIASSPTGSSFGFFAGAAGLERIGILLAGARVFFDSVFEGVLTAGSFVLLFTMAI
jgi:hypothetical protein